MKISYRWLQDLIPVSESADELGKLLTSTGLEVEGIEEVESIKGGLKGVVIGEVLTCEKHPEADRLSLTTVNVGGEQPLSIVCGAPNVAAGQKVVVATIGARLYPTGNEEGFEIKKSKIRGAVSEGMLCAEDELGLGASHDGILVLNTDLPNGTPAVNYFNLDSDYLIEIGLTPNRADAASHYGVARDIRAVTGTGIVLPDVSGFAQASSDAPVDVLVENAEAAPRYAGVTISGIKVSESPDWLKSRLNTIGVRPINNVVDATNYVCHELGQPLHAFDLAAVKGNKVVVKTVEEGTTFVTLDGVERKLTAQDLMICNAEEPMCIAGVFGGQKSGVSDETTAIFLESAYFSPVWIRRTAQRFGLKTDASFRFERGTDPNMPLYALKRAALLIRELAGGSISSEVTDLYPEPVADFQVPVKYRNINRLIGKELTSDRILTILGSLDIKIASLTEEGFTAIVPPYRVDVQREADIIEEILRIYGFDNVELSDALSSEYFSDFPVNDPDKLRLRVSEVLASNGFNEIINNSLTKPEYSAALAGGLEGEDVVILNHLSEDLSVMRRSLLYSALETVVYNVNRRQRDLKLFEFGKVYQKIEGKYSEKNRLSVVVTGNANAETWLEKSRPSEFHDLAKAVSQLLASLRIASVDSQSLESVAYEYGLTYLVNKRVIGTIGKVAQMHTRKMGIKGAVWYADLDWEYLVKQYKAIVASKEISRFPEVRRDLSLVLDKGVSFEQLKQIAFRTEKNLLQEVNAFDVFEGESLGGKKAYALSFVLQDAQQTLTDQTIDKVMQKLMATYEREFGAVIRK